MLTKFKIVHLCYLYPVALCSRRRSNFAESCYTSIKILVKVFITAIKWISFVVSNYVYIQICVVSNYVYNYVYMYVYIKLCICMLRGEWPSGLNSLRQVTEVKLGRVRSKSGWVTSEA